MKDGIPICLGYLSVSFAFGIFAVSKGMKILEAVLMSMANLTSAGQLAAVPIIVGGGSLWELISSQLVINLRYALMSVSLSQKFETDFKTKHRFGVAYGITDEIFAVSSAKSGKLKPSYLYGLIFTPFLGWSFGTLFGAVAGDILPALITSALGIAIYGMFVAIVLPPAKQNKAVAICSLAAMAISCLFYFVPLLKAIPGGFVIIFCAVSVSAVMAFLKPIDVKEEQADA